MNSRPSGESSAPQRILKKTFPTKLRRYVGTGLTFAILLIGGFWWIGVQQNGRPAKSITLFTWNEYHSLEMLDAFTAETGIAVNLEFFEDIDKIEPALKSRPGAIDVVVPDNTLVATFRETQLLRKLDHNLLPHLSNIGSPHRNGAYDPGNQYSVPYCWGTTVIAYRKDKIDQPEGNWSALWRGDLPPGHIAMLSFTPDAYPAALAHLGLPPQSQEPEHLMAASEALLEQARIAKPRYGGFDLVELFIEGEVWLAQLYGSDAAFVMNHHPEMIGIIAPKPFIIGYYDCLAIANDTRKPDEAHALIDFMLRGRWAAKNAISGNFVNLNLAAKQFLKGQNTGLILDLPIESEDFPPAQLSWSDEARKITNRGMAAAMQAAKSEP